MELEQQFNSARDITPGLGVMTVVCDGKNVNIPVTEGFNGALFIAEDQGTYIHSDGSEWLIGTNRGELVKRRFA